MAEQIEKAGRDFRESKYVRAIQNAIKHFTLARSNGGQDILSDEDDYSEREYKEDDPNFETNWVAPCHAHGLFLSRAPKQANLALGYRLFV